MTSDILLKVSKFISERYPYFISIPLDNIVCMVNKYSDNLYYKEANGKILFIGVYLKTDDMHFDNIFVNSGNLANPIFLESAFINKGRNIHFIIAVGEGKYFLRCIKETIKKEDAKTVSWYKNDMSRIHIIKYKEMKLCHG